ncbi:MAG: ATP-binding protein [Deltaproteobacteria bacterium]|nr:ATP-binding protein [Deltaproteobacteria bacterium]
MKRAYRHPSASDRCPVCRGKGIEVHPGQVYAEAALCQCVGDAVCPLCAGTGYVEAPDGRGVRHCTCQSASRRVRLFNEALIPSRHATSTLGSYRHDDEENLPTFGRVMQWTRDYAPKGENRGLVLFGKVGRGKTHLMAAMLQHLALDVGVSVRFVEFSHLLSDLKGSFDRKSGSSDLLEPLVRVRVLGIDELGKGRNTEWEGTVLDELISRRYNAAATVLATTNYPPGRPAGRRTPNLAAPDDPEFRVNLVDRVGDRVYSRLRQMCDFAPLGGRDWREMR